MKQRANHKLLGFLVVFLTALPLSVHAAKTPSPSQETFSALEGANEAEQRAPKPELVEMTKPQDEESSTKRLPGKRNSRGKKKQKEATATKVHKKTGEGKGSFDPVPNEQRDLIARRLKLVEELLKKYGRAYDYRVYTAHELQQIIKDLEANLPAPDGEKRSAPLPPPQSIPNSWSQEKS